MVYGAILERLCGSPAKGSNPFYSFLIRRLMKKKILFLSLMFFVSTTCFASESIVIENAKKKDVLDAAETYMIKKGAVVKNSTASSIKMYQLNNSAKGIVISAIADASFEKNWYFSVSQTENDVILALTGEVVERPRKQNAKIIKRPVPKRIEESMLQEIKDSLQGGASEF